MPYTSLIFTAALLASPAVVTQDMRPPHPLPPHPQIQNDQMMEGGERSGQRGNVFYQARTASTTFEAREMGNVQFERRMMPTTTPDGRPIPPPVFIKFIASTTNAMPMRLMGSSTEKFRVVPMPPRQEMGSTSRQIFFRATTQGGMEMPPPPPREEMMGSSTSDKEPVMSAQAGTSTPEKPPRPVIQFFHSIFGRFFQ